LFAEKRRLITEVIKIQIPIHEHRFRHFNLQYIYPISYKIAKKANPSKKNMLMVSVNGVVFELQIRNYYSLLKTRHLASLSLGLKG